MDNNDDVITDAAEPTEAADLVVVGGGLAGLSAAATAARAGLRVVLLESRNAGGRAAVTTVDPGVVFNSGPRAFYLGGAAEATLASLGITISGGTPDSAHSYGVRDGQLHRLPAGPLTLLRTRLLSARSKVAVAKVLASLGRLDPSKYASVSLRRWMDDAGLADDAQALLSAVVRTATYSAELDGFSADAALGQVQLALGPGVRYPDGGFAQLVDALRATALAAGAELVEHEAVRAVEHAAAAGTATGTAAGSATGSAAAAATGTAAGTTAAPRPAGAVLAGPAASWNVRTSDRTIGAQSVVIATGGPDSVDRLLPVELDRSGIGEPVTAACLELAVRRPPEHPLLLGIGDPLYLSRHTPAAGGLAPEGITIVHLARYGARTSDEDRRDLWAHAALAGLGTKDVVAERFLHRMVVTGGLPLPETGGLAGRPSVEVAGADGLFIAGDWVGAEGMLADAALASGRRAAELASERAGRLVPGSSTQRHGRRPGEGSTGDSAGGSPGTSSLEGAR